MNGVFNKNTKKNVKVKKTKSNKLINSNIITTPCEKVLSILRQVKNFLLNFSKDQTKLIQNLDWCIKIITGRSLYSYELKEKETINKLSKGNPEFKELVDFVSEYNEKVIQMNRKYNYILTDKLLEKASTQLNKRRIERQNSFGEKDSNFAKFLDLDKFIKQNTNEKYETINNSINRSNHFDEKKKIIKPYYHPGLKINNNSIDNNNNSNENAHNTSLEGMIKSRISYKKKKKQLININDDNSINKTDINNTNTNTNTNTNDSIEYLTSTLNTTSTTKPRKGIIGNSKTYKNKNKLRVSFDQNCMSKKSKNFFPSVQKISITINNEKEGEKKRNESSDNCYEKSNSLSNNLNSANVSFKSGPNEEEKKKTKKLKLSSKSRKNIPHFKEYSYQKVQSKLIHEGYDISKLITEKNFNIFELKELIGYNNVLPIMGRVILENLGILDEGILNISKLDNFLISVSNQYKRDSLYHNCLHGSDVTHSVYIFFTHSNVEKTAKTNVLDLLSIIIAALGHDIGHPGLTNTFHINDSTEIAITYNDISVLENFHASTLFRTIRKKDNNIFEKLSTSDYKIIRKRMISEILATDMANHGKVMSLIKSKIILNENNEYKLNLLSGNEQTKNEEQQSLLDFMLHLADLAHNTKLFSISKKWVELLSEEFWKQGDLEKELNLPVSFLCDREQINIPQSQKGFITGYVIPTFESLVTIFPTLRFTLDNAKTNLKEWQKLMDEGRKKGWTPEKKNKEEVKSINTNMEKPIINKKNTYNDYSSFLSKNLKFKNSIENNNNNNDIIKKEDNNKDNNTKNDNISNDNKKNSINSPNILLKISDKNINNINKSRNNNLNIINNSYNNKNRKNISKNKKLVNNNTTSNNRIKVNNSIHHINNSKEKKQTKNKLSICDIKPDNNNNNKNSKNIKEKEKIEGYKLTNKKSFKV